jgi:hypothetical protein
MISAGIGVAMLFGFGATWLLFGTVMMLLAGIDAYRRTKERKMDVTQTLKDFAKWSRDKAASLVGKPVDVVVEEFKREQAIREEHKDDASDAGRAP